MSWRFVRFLVVGSGTTALNLLLLWLLVDRAGLHYLAACTVSFFALNGLGYLLHKGLTFRKGATIVPAELLRFFLVMACSLGLNLLLMAALVRGLGLNYLLASVVVSALLTVFNYGSHRDLTFRVSDRTELATPRILQLSAYFPGHGGGIEVVAGRLASGLAAQGFALRWMAAGPVEGLLPGEFQTLPVAAWDPLEKRFGLPFPLWSPRALVRLWREIGACDGLHVHDYLYVAHLLAICMARLRGRPILLTQHIGAIPYNSRLLSGLLRALNRSVGLWALRRAAARVFVGRPVQDYFRALTRRPIESELVPNGVDHQHFRPASEREERSGPRLLFVGRFVEKKGMNLIRQCLDLPAHWRFAGWGPLDPADWSEAPRERVRRLGRLSAAELLPEYQQADLLVLPSCGEGFPLVVQEALACGTPVLVSTEVAEAFPELDPRCVFDVELRVADPATALHLGLAALLADPARLAAARGPARLLAAQWDWTHCAARYAELWRRLLQPSTA